MESFFDIQRSIYHFVLCLDSHTHDFYITVIQSFWYFVFFKFCSGNGFS
jgi:hypothetical protein